MSSQIVISFSKCVILQTLSDGNLRTRQAQEQIHPPDWEVLSKNGEVEVSNLSHTETFTHLIHA